MSKGLNSTSVPNSGWSHETDTQTNKQTYGALFYVLHRICLWLSCGVGKMFNLKINCTSSNTCW